ncbi:RNA polymerase sigma factor [Lactobacillus delbrueckii subsp. lactis]|uniref:DNA-directed RNA polymerase sigma-70 factor n=2 Tax=Lactobacillus delbrueckii TaxID=1584 RepID=A0A4Q7DUQ6_9LACO|nr:RNA polymerase sigma factor [Lactobacillus delbrueckii]APG68685.1 RNA polymerase subunit sigma-70 [Lactobacillus delbrueckii subsp. lactis]APG70533.1 RNA polymerase subunit sigma-70 [Lactobacillus delbrueckii subsp. lactis]ASW64491.1 RNA polymerase sigma factor [Lactobacillus delbrueckii subsp. lactis]MCD5444684.1 RNA polymerase sigma factor [Lactobacillus delbrueckii subsp. lactis]MCD5492530.1 RNA polymerase sigma factor [Lactobacillus delbrueckii subsp. lactis]
MRETEIIGQFFARDEAALTSVQSEYGAYCSTIARNILWDKEDVEECLNDTWLKAWNTIPPKRPQSLLAYLGRVTRNGSLNMVRDQNRQKRAGDQYTTSLDEIGELSGAVQGQAELEGIESSALTEIINDFLAGLPKEKRIIFVQRYFYMDAISDIAAANGMTVSAVKVSLLRMRRKLGKKLQEEKYI